ncbi:phenylalanine--tRNA ligase subunit beta [Desulfovibrio inopinatus]|uniref:phenylalanine--tRNA ligase subunit beta n=1 Tax=Desulfovibrio inopinatus TaxID=102109 RepID=UPI00040366B9|nr:phenylalanine--tRNA ligase subunit beta [Desulfovibrio inopinatus]
MLLSLNWLREFVPYTGSIQELADRLTMLGLEMEEIIRPFQDIDDVIVGHVTTRESHPDADKLSVCTVDVVADEPLTIVCGAPNVAAGQNVPVATVGTVLPGDFKIKKSKIRGVVSLGMICSEKELGLAEESSGIMVLPEDLNPGEKLVDALRLDTEVLDVGVTPNRPDCLSVIGLAREIALAFNLPMTLPAVHVPEDGPDTSDIISIEIPDPDTCPVFQVRALEDVTVGPSPDWLRWRLLAVGQRPINNIVDVTNYVLMELGQPLHAYDFDLLKGNIIGVRRAEEGQKFVTLDDQERTLTAKDMIIFDAERAVGLAGVMGGANSEMQASSTRVLLESAVFHPPSIRHTARRLGLSSEASYRFERGVDQPGSRFALNRAAGLMHQVAGGQVRPGIVTNEPSPWTETPITFRPARAASLLGIDLDEEFCRKTFVALGMTVECKSDSWTVTPPPFRPDLEREVDLIEEAGRVYGLDRIPAILPAITKDIDDQSATENDYSFANRLKTWAVGKGFNEAINYSFVGQTDLDLFAIPDDIRIPVANPLSEDQNVMRPTLIPGLMMSVRQNMSQGNTNLRLFEVARVFHAAPQNETGAFEPTRIGLVLSGRRNPNAWPWPDEECDYADLKGVVENLLTTFGHVDPTFTLKTDHPWLEPCVVVSTAAGELGVMGRVMPDIADSFLARKNVWVAELDADLLASVWRDHVVKFVALPKYPPVKRDITLIASVTLSVAKVFETINSARIPNLDDTTLIAVYQPEDNTEERNLSFRLTYRHPDKTLKDKEVDKLHAKLADSLTSALPVRF